MHETFLSLLLDPNHWLFELLMLVVFDLLVGAILWPFIKKYFNHGKDDHADFHESLARLELLEERLGVLADAVNCGCNRCSLLHGQILRARKGQAATMREHLCLGERPRGHARHRSF